MARPVARISVQPGYISEEKMARDLYLIVRTANMASLTVEPAAAQVPAAGGKSTHTLTNPGAGKIVFKVRSSNNNEYRLNPVFGFVEAGAGVPVEITRLAGAPKEDKLVIEYGDAPADVAAPQDAFKGVPAPQKLTLPISAQ